VKFEPLENYKNLKIVIHVLFKYYRFYRKIIIFNDFVKMEVCSKMFLFLYSNFLNFILDRLPTVRADLQCLD